MNSGQNECVFRHTREDMCYYVFVSVQNVPDGNSWRICEVMFDWISENHYQSKFFKKNYDEMREIKITQPRTSFEER